MVEKFWFIGIAFPLALFILRAPNTTYAGEPLQLKQAIDLVLGTAPAMAVAQLTDENSKLEVGISRAQILPQLDAFANHSAGYFNERDFTNERREFSTSAGLTLKQNLYDNGKSWGQIEISKIKREISQIELLEKKNQLILSTASAFFDFSLAQLQLSLSRQEYEALEKQARRIEARYRQGLTSSRDYLRIRTQLESSEIGLLSESLRVEEELKSLRTLLGVQDSPSFVPYEASTEIPSEEKISSQSPAELLVLKKASLLEKLAELQLKQSERDRGFSIYALASGGLLRDDYHRGDGQWRSEAQASVNLNYRLWDWGGQDKQRQTTENSKRIVFEEQKQARADQTQLLRLAETRLEQLSRSLILSSKIVKSAQEAYNSLNQDYLGGKATYLDLVTALTALYSARGQELSLKYQILKLRVELASYTGRAYEVVTAL